MIKNRLIYSLCILTFIISPMIVAADNLVGDYCFPIKWGNLIMRFTPSSPISHEGVLSIIHHDSDGPTCLIPDRMYKLENQQVIAQGIEATYAKNTIIVSFPYQWMGNWNKNFCFGEPPNPC